MATSPTKSRDRDLRSLGRRTVTAVDAVAPSRDDGFDVTEWDQVLLVVTAGYVGVAELLLYLQYQDAPAYAGLPNMVPGLYLASVPLKDHTLSYRGSSVYVINTMYADRLFPAVVSFTLSYSELTEPAALYLNVLGITPKGGTLVDSTSVTSEDVDIAKWGSTAVGHGGTAGYPGVGGIVAHGSAASGTKPVMVGAKATAADPTAVDEADIAYLSTDLAGRLRVLAQGVAAHGAAVAGNPVLTGAKATAAEPTAVDEGDVADLSTTLAGRLRVDVLGNVAHDAADAGAPVKIGFRAEQTLITAVADGDRVDGVADLYGRQVVRDGIAADEVTGANRGAVNTTADDRDESHQVIASQVDDATDPDYFPSSSGYEVGNRPWLTFQLGIRDGVVTFESSNDGTSWTDVTKMVVDRGQGGGGYASWSEPDSATVYYQLELMCGARYLRVKWDPNNATSIIYCYLIARAA